MNWKKKQKTSGILHFRHSQAWKRGALWYTVCEIDNFEAYVYICAYYVSDTILSMLHISTHLILIVNPATEVSLIVLFYR